MPVRLLLVAADDQGPTFLGALRQNGFAVTVVASGRGALSTVMVSKPDVIVMDVVLPEVDGFEICRRLRTQGVRTPILFLSARDSTQDKVRGFRVGADDYIAKPFSLDELVARVRAVLRRADLTRRDHVLRCADLELDDQANRVTRNGVEIGLSFTEYKLLRYLLLNHGRVVSKPQILAHVWGYDFGGVGGNVETYIGYLRRKVDHREPHLIHTVRGVGYTLRPNQSGTGSVTPRVP
jgi:two-component system, OmpR family, response regulator